MVRIPPIVFVDLYPEPEAEAEAAAANCAGLFLPVAAQHRLTPTRPEERACNGHLELARGRRSLGFCLGKCDI